jgi:ribonuclease P protein component
LRRPAEFRRVYDQGVRFQAPMFAAFCLKVNPAGKTPRFGFTLPKAVGKAVVRNRIRRRLREQVRLELLPEVEAQWWIVFNPRRSLEKAALVDLQQWLGKLRGFLRRAASRPSADTNA